MQFQISTPETVGKYVAIQASRKASKRKSAHGPDMESSTKKQKIIHGSLPPAAAQSQVNATAHLRLTGEPRKLVGASLAPAPAQAQDLTNLKPSTEKRKPGHRSIAPTPAPGHDMANRTEATQRPELDHGSLHAAQAPAPAQNHSKIDLAPTAKKQKLSYASLPPGRVKHRMSSEESDRIYAGFYRRRLMRWCHTHRYDYGLLDQSKVPDTLLISPDFDVHEYMATQSSKVQAYGYGPPESDVYPLNGAPTEKLMAETPKPDAHRVAVQKTGETPHRPPFLHSAAQLRRFHQVSLHIPAQGPISGERSDSGNQTSYPLLAQSTTNKPSLTFHSESHKACPSLGDQISTSRSSIDSTSISPNYSSPNVGCNTITPSSRDLSLRDGSTPSSSSQCSSDDPAPNKGGRPRGRKLRTLQTPKGPTRFQKNHPIKARVNIDVWENILLFCPPDFLLKARSISSTFRSVLKDDSFIWKRTRTSHFGPDMPDPPLGLSEPQYADLITGTGCQTRGCKSTKARKTYWAFQKRLCVECFETSFLPPRALKRVFKELETSETPQYRRIARYYQSMDEFLPAMKFDRWDNYQWLGEYDPTPSWGQVYRSGQYTAYPATAYASFSTELATFVGNEYDVENGRFLSNKPMPGKTCPPQEAIDAWFDAKRAANDALVPELQAVENWYECYKRDNQKAAKDVRKSRETFYEEQAELAGLNADVLKHFKSYQAAIAISKPASMHSWKILLPKIMKECEESKKELAEEEAKRDAETEAREKMLVEEEAKTEAEEWAEWDAQEEADAEAGIAVEDWAEGMHNPLSLNFTHF